MFTQAHPKLTEGSDVASARRWISCYVQKFGQDTPIPSMQLSIEPVDQSGGCAYGYACVYTDTISWAAPDQPLPMVRDPRMVFEQLFGAGGTPEQRAAAPRDRPQHPRHADEPDGRPAARRSAGRSRSVWTQYATNIREIEQRISRIEARNTSGEARELPGAPAGVPDSFDEHVKLMFDLQVLAFASDTTRVFSFKLGRDGSGRVYPGSGVDTRLPQRLAPRRCRGAHPAVQRNQQVPRLAAARTSWRSCRRRWTATRTCSTRRSSSTARRWPIGNMHNHRNCPLILLGHGGGVLEGGLHVKAAKDTPMANVMLTLLHKLGLDDIETVRRQHGRVLVRRRQETTVAQAWTRRQARRARRRARET